MNVGKRMVVIARMDMVQNPIPQATLVISNAMIRVFMLLV